MEGNDAILLPQVVVTHINAKNHVEVTTNVISMGVMGIKGNTFDPGFTGCLS
jgi:hypothetical protein